MQRRQGPDRSAQDHRASTRVDIQLPVRVARTEDEITRAVCTDISLGGLRVKTPRPLTLGIECELEVHLTGIIGIHLRGTVVRTDVWEFAIRTEEVDEDGFDLLWSLVRFSVEDPRTVDDQFRVAERMRAPDGPFRPHALR